MSTRDRIAYAALKLIASHGINKASMRDIAEEVGISKAGIYHHFPSKEGLLVSVVELFYFSYLEKLIALMENGSVSPIHRLRNVFEFAADDLNAWIYRLTDENIERISFDVIVYELIAQCPKLSQKFNDLQQQRLAAATATLEECKIRGEIRDDLDCTEGAQTLVALLYGSYFLCSDTKGLDIKKTYENMSKMYMRIIKS